MASFERWVDELEDEYGRAQVGGDSYLVIYEEDDGVLTTRNRVQEENLWEMFGEVIEEANSLDELYARDLEAKAGADPDGESELDQMNWEFDHIIDDWVERGLITQKDD